MRVVSCCLVLLCLPATVWLPATAWAQAAPKAQPWEALGREDGIEVWRKVVPGSDLVAVRGRAIVKAPIGKVLWVLSDDEHRPEWVAALRESRVLERPTPTSQIVYQSFELPWFASDRDFVFEAEATQDPQGRVLIRFASCEHAQAPETVGVRAHVYEGSYLLTPVPTQPGSPPWTRVEVEIHADPRGWLPDWLVNNIQKGWPVTTLRGLRRQVQKPYAQEIELPPPPTGE